MKIRQEFGISATAIGALQSAWSITYALCQVPIGYFLDRLGPRYLVGIALLLWSLAQAAGGLAGQLRAIAVGPRGIGCGGVSGVPGGGACHQRLVPREGPRHADGTLQFRGRIGPLIAPPLLTGLMLAFDWRMMFIAMGAIGVLGAAGVVHAVPRSGENRTAGTAGRGLSRNQSRRRGRVGAAALGQAVSLSSMWGLMLGAFCTGYAVWMYQTWLPAYLEMQQHISIAQTGFLASIPLFCSIIGAWSGGWFTDRLTTRGMELVASRRLPGILGLVLSGMFTVTATTASSPARRRSSSFRLRCSFWRSASPASGR